MRKQQSLWKMGTAETEAELFTGMDSALTEGKGRGSKEANETANACHTFCEEVGSETGGQGVELSAGLAQHAGVEQCLESQPLQQQFDFALLTGPANTAETPCHTKTNPKMIAIAVLTNRDAICVKSVAVNG